MPSKNSGNLELNCMVPIIATNTIWLKMSKTMPIYEYQCTACETSLEKIQKISDPVLSTCPECKKDTLKKKISSAGFRLKGSGWYETDFKSGNKKNLADTPKPKNNTKQKD